MKKNLTYQKAMSFAIRIVNVYKFLTEEKAERVMSKQLLRSGTLIGANFSESLSAESDSDFIHKLAICQKEANETLFWLAATLPVIDSISPNPKFAKTASASNALLKFVALMAL